MHWRTSSVATTAATADWWQAFGSDELSALVQAAQVQSQDIAAAVARVRQADAAARMAGATLLPTVTTGVDAGREGRLAGHAGVAGTSFSADLSASYEVDLWGRLASNRDAARAISQASRFDRDAVRLTVTAGVASAWLQAVALTERQRLAEKNLATAERLLVLVESRARAGAATPLELAQQRGLVANQRRVVSGLKQQAEDARSAVAALLGQAEAPRIVHSSVASLSQPNVDADLPSTLLTRRPDIASAEARLAAADANVAAARAAMLPSLSLGGSIGTRGDRVRRVLDNPVYSLAAALMAPIFDAGRLAASRDLAQAQRQELLATYRQSIVAAFADVEVLLNAVARLAEQSAAQDETLSQAQQALVLAESRYRAGAETLLVLLDAQRTVSTSQDLAVQIKLARLQAAVSLYRALGGGWSTPEVQSQPQAILPLDNSLDPQTLFLSGFVEVLQSFVPSVIPSKLVGFSDTSWHCMRHADFSIKDAPRTQHKLTR